MPVILIIVNTNQGSRELQKPDGAVYEKRGHTVNTDLQHSHSVPALAYINYLAN